MPTITITNYTHPAAKAIIARMYEADKTATTQNYGLAMIGNNIKAQATATAAGYSIEITSNVFEERTLRDLVEEGLDKL